MANCKVNNNCGQVLKKYEDIALNQDKELAAICSVNAVLCKEKYGFIINSRKAIKEALDKNKNIPAFYESALFSQQMAAEGFIFNVELARDFKNKYNISDEDATRYAMIVSAIGVGKAIKGNSKNSANQYSSKDIAFSQGYKFKEGIDLDLRGKQVYTKDAVQLAFEKTGVPKDQFVVTKWGYDQNGKSIPVEYKTLHGSKYKGAEVSVDVCP